MEISVCTTVLNEEESISRLLDSLLNQSKKPNEIITVDGGSTDKTVEIIRHYQKKDKRIKLLIEPGSIAHGRNTAVEIAKYPIVAFTDAGCVAKKDWLAKLTEVFKYKSVGVAAGFYDMPAKNSQQKAINAFLGIVPVKFDPTSFMPSTRSVAFRKEVWQMLGGFPENLSKAGEDTVFFHKAVAQGVKIARVKEARVEWRELEMFTLKSALKKIFHYAEGDAQAGIWWHSTKHFTSHNIKVMLIFVRYLLGLALLFLSLGNPLLWFIVILGLVFYILWSFRKIYFQTHDKKAGLWGVVMQFSSDVVVMAGFLKGIYEKR